MIISWPEVVLCLDGDAFFASVTQAVHPELKGKPVVTGWERGIATAVSYEARALGIKRGMPCWEIAKQFPHVTITHSDYRLYHLFSEKMFAVMRRYSPCVEVYSVDEGFADLKGMRRPLHMSYEQIAATIKREVENSLGITVSIGVSVTKSLAKLAVNSQKPSGLTVIPGKEIDQILKKTDIEKVWGIGFQTTAFLRKLNINTAYEFAKKSEPFIKQNFSKPYQEIWRELNGEMVYAVNPNAKREYKSITRSSTVTPATNDKDILWARLLVHVEDSFFKARNYNYAVKKVFIFLKDQSFHHHGIEIKLAEATSFPMSIRHELKEGFEKIYKKNMMVRASGATIYEFSENNQKQASLFFGNSEMETKAKSLYPMLESKKVDFGTSLFDSDRLIRKKKEIKLSLPLLSRLE
ncbi:MAG: DNA polymerase IV [Candidatus Levybacteria bacterium]|nr:DNA polymerase IV [Candidatus Levybacteria bacterium]